MVIIIPSLLLYVTRSIILQPLDPTIMADRRIIHWQILSNYMSSKGSQSRGFLLGLHRRFFFCCCQSAVEALPYFLFCCSSTQK
ncbi:hypothetical protein F4810DRAFT_664560 [Camillea tinctor]|nr:hypothetical protein F4810DRAFT_664560 [Camillea tinctor]